MQACKQARRARLLL